MRSHSRISFALAMIALAGSLSAQTTWTQAILPGAPFPSDLLLTSQTSGINQFGLTFGAGGSLARMRANRENNKELIPYGTSTTDSNAQWSLTADTALDDGNAATDDRFHLRQAGGAGNRLAPVMQIEPDPATHKVDVYAVAQDQWSAHLRAAVQSKVSHLTRYEPLSDGSIKVRRIIRFGNATVNGSPFDISAPLFENLHSFHVGNFNALAEKLQNTGAPDVFYQQGSNIPQNLETDVSLTQGYGVVYNTADTVNRAAVGVVFGKTQMASPNQMVVNYSDSTTDISVRPGIRLTNAAPGSILDVTYFLVPSHGLNSALKTRLDNLVASVPVPVIYPPGFAFTGELATIAQRLNDNLALTGKRSDRLGHDVTPAPIVARPMLLNGPEDDADIRARLVVFPQSPETLLQNYLYGTAADKQAATTYFFRYPGSGDGNGLRTNYNSINPRHMMWDQYRYDTALGLEYATQAQKDLMLSLTVSFINSKSTYIRPDGTGGGNLALEAYIAIGLAGLNFPDHPDAQFWLSRSVTNVKKIVDTYFPDGAGTESPRYHDWSLEILAIYLRALQRRAGIDLYDEPGIRSALEWLIRFSSPPVSLTSNKSVTPAWGDSTYSSNVGTHYYYNLGLFAPYYRERDPDFSARLMGWWIRNGRPRDLFSNSTSKFTNILMLDSRIPDAPVRPNTSTYSPRIGHATLRSGSGTNDEFFASFKCGTQGDAHQDGDIGHIDLFAFGVPLALDSTSGSYSSPSFNPANAAHNTVRFNGVGAWDSVSGVFNAFGTSAIADYAVGNTKYGTVSNRHLVMMKGDYLVVWDETTASNYADWFFRVPGSATLEWQDHKVISSTPWGVNLDVHFVLPAEPLIEPTYAGSYIPTSDPEALRNQLASQPADPGAPGMFTMMGENEFGVGVSDTSRNPFPFQWLKYFSVRNGPDRFGDFLTVMHPRKVGVTPEITTELVSQSATAVTLRVHYNGRTDTIALTSTGATITKGNEPPVLFSKTWPQSGVSGAAGYVKSDFYTAPVTTLTNAITTTGPVEVHTGELALGAANRIPDTATLMVKPGAAFNTATFNETVGTLLMNGGELKGSGTLTASSIEWWGGIVTVPVSATGNFVKKGGADWSRPANLTYFGDTVIESGNLVFKSGTPALPGTGRVVLRNGTGIALNGTTASISSLDVSGNTSVSSGTLSVTQSLTGTGTLTNTGTLDLSAVTTIDSTLSLSTTGSLNLPAGNWSVKRLILHGVIQRAGVVVNATTHPGLITGTGTITALEDIPIPTGLSATASLGKIALAWSSGAGVTSYSVRRALVSGGPYTEIATPIAASFDDTNVTDGITYFYVVVARDTSGDSLPSDEVSALAIGPWYFDPNGTTAGSVVNGSSYTWVSNSWTKTPGGAAAVEAWGPARHAHFAASNPGSPLAYSVSLAGFTGASHGFQSLRVAHGNVTFTGAPGNFYWTQPPVITADTGTTIRFAQTGAHAFNLNNQNVTFDGAGTTLVSNDTVIMNGGSITKSGTGTLVLAASNTYTGSTTINGGTLRLATTDLPTLWLDATKASSMALTSDAVSQWNDANGKTAFVSQATAANQPVLTTDATLPGPARALVDFGPYIYYSTPTTTTADWMQFNAATSDIRALFWVGKTTNSNFLLGSTSVYHFHNGGAGSVIWNGNASANIRDGTTWLNGTEVTGTTTNMPTDLVRVAAFPTANVSADNLGRDRTFRYGGISPGEVMVFNTVLTPQQQTDIDAYLAKKWSNTGIGIGNRLPTNTVVSLSNSATLDLTGINFQTIAGLEANDSSDTRVELGAAELTISGAGSSSFDGIISGTGSLRKNSSGQFTLKGNHTYTGPTTVEGGTLVVEDSVTSNVTVKTGAMLVNNGTITGDVIIESGGTYLGDGNITGTITTSPPVVTITSPAANTIVLPDLATDLNLAASIVFNAAFGTPSITWSLVTGTGTVTFENPNSLTTTARFSATGSYTLRCIATVTVNGQLMQGSADLVVLPGGPATNNFTTTFREGVNSYSHAATFIRGDSVSWNSGARDQFLIGRNNGGMRGLFAFDLTTIPTGATVTSAAFDLWITASGIGTVNTLELRPLLKDFVEGTGNSSTTASVGADTGADWNSRTGPTTANLWGTTGGQSGTDFSTTVIGSLAGFDAATAAVGNNMGFTLTPAFVTEANAALSAARPLRFMLTMSTDTTGGNRFARFASDDYATINQRPQLTLNYFTTNPAVPTVNPGPPPAAMSKTAASLAGNVGNASGGAQWSLVSGPGEVMFGDATQPATAVTFSVPGDYVLRLAASNASGTVSHTLAVTVTLGFTDWQAIHWPGVSDPATIGESSDPDNDGVTNLGEFNAGTDPKDVVSRPSFVWTSTTSGTWTTGANWNTGTPPTSHPATELEFLTSINPGPVSITANNDNAGNFRLNSLTLSGIHTAPATTVVLNGNPLEFSSSAGALPSIYLTTDSSNFKYQIDTPLVLSADTTIDASSPGNIVLKGIISGPGGLTRTGSAGTLVLAGNNTYTGPTVINSGTLKLADVVLPAGLQIMPMGDSITYGDQGSDAGYRGPLYNLLNPVATGFNFVGSLNTVQANVSLPSAYLHHEGHSGWTAAQLTSGNFLAPGNGVNPDVILLQIGTNDLLTYNGYNAQLQTDLETLLTQLTTNQPSARILLAKITPTTNRNGVASYNAMVATVAANFQSAGKLVTLVDNNTNFPALGLADGTHPNDAGYQWLAGNWFDAIATSYSTGGTSSALATSSSVTLAQGATLDLNYNSANIGALAGQGTVLLRSGALVTASGSNSQFSGIIDGPGNFTKGGTGTLTLSGPNTYAGVTAVTAGTLQINPGGSLGSASGALALGTGSSGVIGTVANLSVNGNVDVGAMFVRQNTATLTGNDIASLTIATGATLGTASLDIGVLGNNQRTAIATGAGNSGGTLAVAGDVTIGKQNTGTSYQSVDLSGLATFTAGSGSGNVFRVGYGALNEATLTLASTTNTIHVGTLSIGETFNWANSGRNNILNLGPGTNTLQTANLTIGMQKASGVLRFAGADGSVTLTGPGSTGTANITLGDNSSASYQPGALHNQLSLAGHQASVSSGAVIIGRKSGGGAGNVTASVTFDTGTFDANSISMAVATSGNAGTVVTGSFTLGTTPAATGILTVANDFVLASNTFSTNAVSTFGSLAITGGTAIIHGNIRDASTTTNGTSTTTLTLNGGTLDMTNGTIGGNASGNRPITHLLFQSGILKNVAQINGGSTGLSKSSSGTLEIAGVNSYTGPTTIEGGTLLVSGSLTSNLTATSGTLAPQSTPSTTGSLAIPSGGTLAASPGNTLSIGGSATLAGNLSLIVPADLTPSGSYTLLSKSSAGAISGTFAGKPEGAVFSASGYNWKITYTGGDGNDVIVSLLTAVEQWRLLHFDSTDNAADSADTFDANNDGENNLLEFATGQNPHAATRASVSLISTPGSMLDFTYSRNRAAFDAGYLFNVEYSDTLGDPWTSVGPGTVFLDGPPQSVRALIPGGSAGRRFIRLKVSIPP